MRVDEGDAAGISGIAGAEADGRVDAVFVGELGQGQVDAAAEDAGYLPEPAGRLGSGGLLGGGGLGQGLGPGDCVPGADLLALLLLLPLQRGQPGFMDAPSPLFFLRARAGGAGR